MSEVDREHYRTNVFPSLLKEYDSKNIFNGDEFGHIFSNVHPTEFLHSKGIHVTEGKIVKNVKHYWYEPI